MADELKDSMSLGTYSYFYSGNLSRQTDRLKESLKSLIDRDGKTIKCS